jgi:mono/diheme cytochrome c family protein
MQADAMIDVSGQKQFRCPMLVVTACLVLSAMLTMPARAAGDAARGEPLYQRYCSGCHGVDGHGGAKNFMPHVGALTKKGYIELLEDEYLATVIAEGGEAIGKSGFMPSWKTTLSKQDIADVIAYIRTFTLY